nr:MAG TPA: hypothetical protein [Caudoviricetes sp.]
MSREIHLVQNNGLQCKCTQCIAKQPFLKVLVRTNQSPVTYAWVGTA